MYPTQEYVEAVEAQNSCKITCLKMNEQKWVKNINYPRQCFYKFKYVFRTLPTCFSFSKTKIIFRIKDEYEENYNYQVHHTKWLIITDGNDEETKGHITPQYIYLGSHNMSAGAWGSFKQASK